MNLRKATNNDSAALIVLIDSIYSEYGEVMHTTGADSDLLEIEGQYCGRGGDFVVLEDGQDHIVGCHAALPIDPGAGLLTFRRLYLEKSLRGGGHGIRLMDWAVQWAREKGYRRVEFWSDTRFTAAHKFFENYGFEGTGEVRDMNDGALPYSEYFFRMSLSGTNT
ncbi:MAG: GNAT family N-acetyltransferase [Verrucomicrobiales bacterium]